MKARNIREELLDPAELGFRLDSIPAGGWITIIASASAGVYVGGWADKHQLALALLLAVAFVVGIGVFFLPWDRIVRSPLREAAFLAWSFADIALIIAIAVLDGGGESPLALLLFIPIVFAGVSYPRASVAVVSGATIGAYLGLAVASGVNGGAAVMFSSSLACVALMSFWQARNHERRRELLLIASRTDPLTGSLNRRGFEQAAAALLAAVSRFERPASLALLDLDRFKAFNDERGHAAGDELLCWVVQQIRTAVRPTDAVARMGGDEFAVLFAGADRAAAQIAVRRVRSALASRVGTSCGLAAAPDDGDTLDALYKRADDDLYEAKRARVGAADATVA
jgi:diguanylate cyclase (GGDEF)-like protein